MKRLYVIRHAKSRKDIPGIGDIERPLGPKGVRAAHDIGRRLKDQGIAIAAFYASPARRALDTARLIAKEIGFPRKNIKTVSNLYDSSIPKLIKIIRGLDDIIYSAALFGHNPEFLDLMNYLTPLTQEKFPACAVFGIDFNVDSWRRVSRKSGKIVVLERPKK